MESCNSVADTVNSWKNVLSFGSDDKGRGTGSSQG